MTQKSIGDGFVISHTIQNAPESKSIRTVPIRGAEHVTRFSEDNIEGGLELPRLKG